MWAYLIGAGISAAVMGLAWFLVDQRRRRAITVVWGEGLTAADVENLRDQVDLAYQDPNYSIITNYQVHWDTHRVPYSGEGGPRFFVAGDGRGRPLSRFGHYQRDSTAEQPGGMLIPSAVSDQILDGAQRLFERNRGYLRMFQLAPSRDNSSEIPLDPLSEYSSPGKTRFEILLRGSPKSQTS